MTTASTPSPRKRHALELFRGLPRHYDRMGAVLSFGQDPRWRRALVRAVDPAARRARPRCRDRHRHGRGRAGAPLGVRGRRRSIRARRCWPRPGRGRDARRRSAGRITVVRGEAERLPFADGEFDALTFTYLLRYVDDRAATMRELARVVKPGGRIGMVEFGVPQPAPLRALWRVHTRVGLPLLGRLVSPAGTRSGASWARTSSSSTRASRTCRRCGGTAGIRDVRLARHELRRRASSCAVSGMATERA